MSVPTALVDLDDASAQLTRVAGAKAATLARARAAGLPALPGAVVPVDVGRAAAERGADALAAGGSVGGSGTRASGHARLAVMEHALAPYLCDALASTVGGLGGRVVVRSSSPLEHHAVWAGAFSSFDGVQAEDVTTAVRGVWASAFTVDALERCEAVGLPVAGLGLAVLVQPEVDATFGGSARWHEHDESVEVVAVKGSPSRLLTGVERGTRATAHRSGRLTGDAVTAVGAEVVVAVADLCRRVADELGHDLVEWAWVDGAAVLLQARTAAGVERGTPAPAPSPELARAMSSPVAERLVAWVSRFGGALAESVLLPWAVALPVPGVVDHAVPSAALPSRDPLEALSDVTDRAAALEKRAWGRTGVALRALADVRDRCSAEALRRLESLAPVDEGAVRHLVELVHGLGETYTARGLLARPRDVWAHSVESLHRMVDGGVLVRRGEDFPDPWEPFVLDFLRCRGTALGGTPASAGMAVGWARVVDHPEARGPAPPDLLPRREVLVAPYPMPALASLLWSAAGLVTGPGDASAHLFEVAASLRVPAVVDADVGTLFDLPRDPVLVALDGTAGHAWTRPT